MADSPNVMCGFRTGPKTLRMLAKALDAMKQHVRFYGIAWGRFAIGLAVKAPTKGDDADAH